MKNLSAPLGYDLKRRGRYVYWGPVARVLDGLGAIILPERNRYIPTSKYHPHQGERERARRRRQAGVVA